MSRYGVWTARYFLLFLPLPVTVTWITVLFNKSKCFNMQPISLPLVYIAVPFRPSIFWYSIHWVCSGNVPAGTVHPALGTSDVGGYLIGMGFGQKNGHKLYPRISPEKIVGRTSRKPCFFRGHRTAFMEAGNVAVPLDSLSDIIIDYQYIGSCWRFDRIGNEETFRGQRHRPYHAGPRRIAGPF